ncbi:MAG: tetratricopeptide repeat protein, partial [Planctomycetes bacterium]|nr:tetratricopeptide repeat protein [Planctomycetota bacterium]
LQYFTRFIKEYPKDELTAGAHHYRGECLYGIGKYAEALDEYKASLAADPAGRFADDATYGMGWCYRITGDAASSRKAFQSVVDQFKDSNYTAECLYLLGVVKHEAGENDAALKDLNRLLTEFPKSEYLPKAYIEVGRILDDTGKHEEAIKAYIALLDTKPGANDSAWALYNLSIAWWNKAKPKFEKASKLETAYRDSGEEADKKAWEDQLKLARADEDQMETVLKRLIVASPEFERVDYAWLRLGEVAYDRHVYDEALDRYKMANTAAEKLGNTVNATSSLYRIAWCLLRQGENAARQSMETEDATKRTALLKEEQEKKKASMEAFLSLAKKYKGNELATEGLFRGAELCREFKDSLNAFALYEQYLKDAANLKGETFTRQARYGLAVSNLEMGKNREALEGFKEFLAVYDKGDLVHEANWGAGQACLNLQAWKDAAAYFEKAMADNYEGEAAARARLGIGMIAFQQQKWELAREEFLKVEAFHSEWKTWAAMALLNSAKAALKLDMKDKAIADLKRVVDRYAATPVAGEAKKMLEEIGVK